MSTSIADPVFLYPYEANDNWVDSRPCFKADGSSVVFMRQAGSGTAPGAIYSVSADPSNGSNPVQVYPFGDVAPTYENQATRPDVSWANSNIAFSGAVTNSEGVTQTGLFVLPADGDAPTYVPILNKTAVISYPTWYPDGIHIAVTNYTVNQILSVDSTNTSAPQSGTALTQPAQLWAGMASINQADSSLVCMAAQLPNTDSNSGQTGSMPGYSQNNNNIWVQNGDNKPYSIQIEGHGNGRAPWWSPDGTCIAYESSYQHADGKSLAIFIYRNADQSITPVTPLKNWSCSHAKWHPTDPSTLVCSATQFDSGNVVRKGVAVVTLP